MSLLTKPPLGGSGPAPFALLVAMTACGTLGMHIIIPALPSMAVALDMSISSAQLTITLYLVGLAVGQLLYGPVSDMWGRRPVVLAGLALFTAASIVTVFAPTPAILIGARIVQSIGGCAGLVLGRAAVRDSATADKAAARLALLTLVMSLVPAIAPAIGGFITAWYGWHASFVLLSSIGALTLLACLLRLPETRAPSSVSRSLVSGYMRLLRSRRFLGYAIGGACSTTAFYGFMSASPFIFERHLGQSPERVGLYYLLLMVGVAAGSLGANRIAGRVPVMTALRIANGIGMVGAILFAVADISGQLSVLTVVGSVTVFMIGAGMASPFALAGCVSVNPQAIGAASGLYGFFQMGYGMLCTIVAETWSPGAVFPIATLLVASTILGQIAITIGARPGNTRERLSD